MGVKTGNSIKDDKINQITDYYFFQKEIDYIINGIDNPLIKGPKKNKNLFTKIVNPYNVKMEKDYYVMDKKWIEEWKKYTNFETAKSYFDKIDIVDKNQIVKEVNEACLNMALTEEINDSKDNFPGKLDNKLEGEGFCKNIFMDLKYLDYLVSEKLFMLFEASAGQYWKFKNDTQTLRIKGVIKNRIMILIFKEQLQIKFIFFNQGLYELTADFCLEDDLTEEKKKKYRANMDSLINNEIRRFQFEDWIDFFNKNGIDEKDEIPILDKNGENMYIIRKNEDITNTRTQQNNNSSSNTNSFNQVNNMNNMSQMNNMNSINNINGLNNMNSMNNNINFKQNQMNNFNNMNNMNQMNLNNMNNMNQMNNFNYMNNMNQMNLNNMNNMNFNNMNQMNFNNMNNMNNFNNMNNMNNFNNMNQMNNFNNMNQMNNFNNMNQMNNFNNMNQMNNFNNMNFMGGMNNNQINK